MHTRFSGTQVPLLFHVHPIVGYIQIHFQWNKEGRSVLHLLANEESHLIHLRLGDLKNQFIVHLQKDFSRELPVLQRLVKADHGQFDYIRSSSLDRAIDCGPFGKLPQVIVFAVDVRDGPDPAEECLNTPCLTDLLDSPVKPRSDALIALEIRVYYGLGLLARNSQSLCQSECRQTVDDPKIDYFGHPAALAAVCQLLLAENLARGSFMNVFIMTKGIDQDVIL